jgi:hypothetical protein
MSVISQLFDDAEHAMTPIPANTFYIDQVTIDGGMHEPFVREAHVLAYPQPTATATLVRRFVHVPLVTRPSYRESMPPCECQKAAQRGVS